MRHLITSLQNHNQQLKGEVSRYKRKLKEAQNELAKVKSASGSGGDGEGNGNGKEKSGDPNSATGGSSEDEKKEEGDKVAKVNFQVTQFSQATDTFKVWFCYKEN